MSESREGWYPDPSGDSTRLRYWDGSQWTDMYADSPSSTTGNSGQASQFDNGEQAYISPSPYAYEMTQQDSTLRLVAFIFCLVSVVTSLALVIPLIWMIPMSVYAWGIYKGKRPNTVAFGVCTLIFVNIISGILLLVSKKDS